MKIEQHFTLTIQDRVFVLNKEEAEELYYSLQSALDKMPRVNIPFQNPIPPYYETHFYCKDFEVTVHPTTDKAIPYPFYSTCKDSVNINTSP